jgi:hypothetical protein
MARYSNIPILPATTDLPRRYANLKYPEVPVEFSDIYVNTTQGDRYDTLALSYYGDSSLWWIISRANATLIQDSLIPPYGNQIRIPSLDRVPFILGAYNALNLNI